MGHQRVLFIGGTGEISAGAARLLRARDAELWVLNRGLTSIRPLPAGSHQLTADVRDAEAVREAVGSLRFDAVVNFYAFAPEHVRQDLEIFAERTDHYLFISSASAYQKPPARWPITESTPLRNPYWEYSRDKIACEGVLMDAYRSSGLPVTIVRPSHTYDRTSLPFDGGWTVIDRMRRDLPVVVHGDGTSLWTITHTDDFAPGLVGLLGDPRTFGEAYHITSDEPVTWDTIYRELAKAAGVPEPKLVHVASEAIAAVRPDWGPRLVGDVSHTAVFDISKVQAIVPDFRPSIPFHQGAREIMAWYDATPEAQVVDPDANAAFDLLVSRYSPRSGQ